MLLNRVTRRDALFMLGAAAAMPQARAAGGESTPGKGNPPQPTFQAGETRILLYNPAPTKPPKIDHFSALVDNFDAPAALKVVQSLGANAKLSAQGTPNEFFDPDGIRLQVTFPRQTYNTPAKK